MRWPPAATPRDRELACTVFQDGGRFLDPEDDLRAAVVLDELVHAGDIPPMVGVFVDAVEARSAEYDAGHVRRLPRRRGAPPRA
ncbi:hypothetical protein [Nocardioides sp.]|uniref:hypothetical protein n=1 Tax=Nocardioides sp. TaxID=35761 RepID=UPI002624A3D5|nr:hypothetical protein [Nocardioides sp.]MCW2735370.1 enterochelin esterase-like enzyme [Nocardioides sp.]